MTGSYRHAQSAKEKKIRKKTFWPAICCQAAVWLILVLRKNNHFVLVETAVWADAQQVGMKFMRTFILV